MPTYEYECTACNELVEMVQSITEPAKTQCPACKKHKLKRNITKSSFILKGRGWFKDGY